VAIVQISRITQRLGLQIDLPQLAGGEFGWSTDSRRLFIGNGTLEEGAPAIGNTEILSEFSDIIEIGIKYTYKGSAATGYTVQTGPTPGTPVIQNFQNWADQFATIKDFGAVGDGATDDTAAINRALNQLYCQPGEYNSSVNPAVRRGLFFPAGVYRVSSTILIPSYALLKGEGANSTIISMDAPIVIDEETTAYTARTADSLQQIGGSIGQNGAEPPVFITIQDMSFEYQGLGDATNTLSTGAFLVEDATKTTFSSVLFKGIKDTTILNTNNQATACLDFNSSAVYPVNETIFENCTFTGATYGIYNQVNTKGVSIANSNFNTLYQGIVLKGLIPTPADTGPRGFRVIENTFDNIYAQGVIYTDCSLNATGFNTFYDVGNEFGGTINPSFNVIETNANNNLFWGDMFERSDANDLTVSARINIGNTTSIASTNSKKIQFGQLTIGTGQTANIVLGTSSNAVITTFDSSRTPCVTMAYTMKGTGANAQRTGTLVVTSDSGSNAIAFTDDFTEVNSANTTLSAIFTGVGATVAVVYNNTSPVGTDGVINFSLSNTEETVV
jgi:hypothetical protein